MKRFQILILSFSLFGLSFGQTECPSPDTTESFDVIFGPDNLAVYGRDTIYLNPELKIIYSCWDCSLALTDRNEKIIWNIDLTEIGCKLESLMQLQNGYKIKGFDILFAPRGIITYGLNSETGKFGKIPEGKIKRLSRKANKRK